MLTVLKHGKEMRYQTWATALGNWGRKARVLDALAASLLPQEITYTILSRRVVA